MPIRTLIDDGPRQRVPVKVWTDEVEGLAREQLRNLASLPFVHRHVAAMPDVHAGIGATVGSVIATKGAIVPAAVGVDIGCGMMAVETSLTAAQLPDSMRELRARIERAVPHGFATVKGRSTKGNWTVAPGAVVTRYREQLASRFHRLAAKHPFLEKARPLEQLGTLGGGNHFVEVCLDDRERVWVMLHSGSRGVGNLIGREFIELAKRDLRGHIANLPDADLAYFAEGSPHFDDYIEAMGWAQDYARENRHAMMDQVLRAMRELLPPFKLGQHAVNCHHNYAEREPHFGEDVWVTRKGAVRAREGELGIIPGSMGARSYIVRGKGNPESFHSCAHGAGRRMSRTEARRRFTTADLVEQTAGVECRKDAGVVDEIPGAYKNIDEVMAHQSDLVDVLAQLRQVLCVKG